MAFIVLYILLVFLGLLIALAGVIFEDYFPTSNKPAICKAIGVGLWLGCALTGIVHGIVVVATLIATTR